MSAIYEVVHLDTTGAKLAEFDRKSIIEASYAKVLNDVGEWRLTIDGNDSRRANFSLDGANSQLDSLIKFRRKDADPSLAWYDDYIGFVRGNDLRIDGEGLYHFTVFGPDLKYLLTADDVLPDTGQEFDAQNAAADTVLYNLVYDNIGPGATDADRRLANFTVALAAGTASNVQDQFRNENLLRALQRVVKAAREAGTGVDFDVIASAAYAFQFKTYVPQLGTDRTVGNGSNPEVIFSTAFQNMIEPRYLDDRSDERTAVYVHSVGEGRVRSLTEIEDTSAQAEGVYNRRAIGVNAPNKAGTSEITAEGKAALRKHRRVRRLVFRPAETPATRYGRDWSVGDLVTAHFDGRTFSCRAVAAVVTYNEDGEQIDGVFESVDL